MKKISIITVCLDAEAFIEQSIESVLSQDYPDREYIVVDGGSTDGTVDIIRRYQDRIDRWVSEPDRGIADAMNKGLAMAGGDYVIFLHADDYFCDSKALTAAAPHLDGEAGIYLFDIFLEKDGRRTRRRPRGLNGWMNLKTGVFHQSAICARDLFEHIGAFDTGFRIAMDYDFFLRAYRAGVRARRIALPISVMRLVGLSSRLDRQGLTQRFAEERRVHEKNCPPGPLRLFYRIYWSLYPAYRRLIRRRPR